MTHYRDPAALDWTEVDVYGTKMQKAVVFEGDYDVRSAFFRMPAGCAIDTHTHSKWVQVMVLEGRMRVEQDGEDAREIGAGECYFVDAGESHAETALVDTMVLVTQGEDRPGMVR